jgi:hypothetical protein
MSEKERIERMMAEVLGLCYEISTNSEADCFFSYSPHVNSFDVHVFEFGWAIGAKGEWYAMSKEATEDNLIQVADMLHILRVKMGG